MPRLGHKKSRNGCRQCKARHVKCDENKPCTNCARHGVVCSLVDANAGPPVATPSSSGSAPKRSTNKALAERPKQASPGDQEALEFVLNPSPAPTSATGNTEADSPSSGSDNFPFLTRFVYRRENVETNLWLRDLELMHHWMSEAVETLSQGDDVSHMWRMLAPKEAQSHTYLMHELLAFSALHMAHLYPERHKDYFAVGIHHQDHALRGMRRTLKTINEENASTLFATSTLLTLSVFASRGQDAQDPGPSTQHVFDDLVDIFALIQGMGIIMAASQMTILKGPFGAIWRDPVNETPAQPVFPQILERLPALTAFIENEAEIDESMRRELIAFIVVMRDNVIRSSRPCVDNRELRFLFYWPLHLSPNFLNWLRQRQEAALVVLMHYAVVLYAAESVYWFMNGWADRLMNAISHTLAEPHWRSAIQWPLQFIDARTRPTPPQEAGIGTTI